MLPIEQQTKTLNDENGLRPIIDEIKTLIAQARASVSREVNTTMIVAYWNVGRIIVEREQDGAIKAKYGQRLLAELSVRLTRELGRGYSRSNLQNMRAFYLTYPICQMPSGKFQMPSGKLMWSHYIELLTVADKDARSFYEQECANSNWSVKELRRQIDSSLFERLLLSKGDANKETVLSLAKQGNDVS